MKGRGEEKGGVVKEVLGMKEERQKKDEGREFKRLELLKEEDKKKRKDERRRIKKGTRETCRDDRTMQKWTFARRNVTAGGRSIRNSRSRNKENKPMVKKIRGRAGRGGEQQDEEVEEGACKAGAPSASIPFFIIITDDVSEGEARGEWKKTRHVQKVNDNGSYDN